jgi:sulfatase maturation enzyme AslB (radical SAM superfamily)
MIRNLISLIQIVLNGEITSEPIRVIRELKKLGIQRLPNRLDSKIEKRLPYITLVKFLYEWLRSEQFSRHNGQWILNSFFPPMPSAAFNRLFTNLITHNRKYNPVSVFCSVTNRCPYNCWHCSADGRKGDDLTTGEWKKIIRELNGAGLGIIGFTGGEPLLRKDLPEIVTEAVNGGAHTILFTSGFGLTDNVAERLKESGLYSMCISIDSVIEDKHNSKRGNSAAFNSAVEAIQKSKTVWFLYYDWNGSRPELYRTKRVFRNI